MEEINGCRSQQDAEIRRYSRYPLMGTSVAFYLHQRQWVYWLSQQTGGEQLVQSCTGCWKKINISFFGLLKLVPIQVVVNSYICLAQRKKTELWFWLNYSREKVIVYWVCFMFKFMVLKTRFDKTVSTWGPLQIFPKLTLKNLQLLLLTHRTDIYTRWIFTNSAWKDHVVDFCPYVSLYKNLTVMVQPGEMETANHLLETTKKGSVTFMLWILPL